MRLFLTEDAAQSDTELHILGYFIDVNNKKLTEAMKYALQVRDERQEEICRKMEQETREKCDRMLEQAISWRGWAENICAGYRSGFEAYDCWVNSEGHRSNMLADFLEFLGVGFAVNSDSTYFIYATQNFYSD